MGNHTERDDDIDLGELDCGRGRASACVARIYFDPSWTWIAVTKENGVAASTMTEERVREISGRDLEWLNG